MIRHKAVLKKVIMQNVIEFQPAVSNRLNWSTIIGVSTFHILAIVGLFMFSWTNLAVAVVIWWLSGSLGIGVGYHRLQTHRGFKTPQWVENVLAVFATLALQAGPLAWVTTHRKHHAFTETEKDPHSPRNGIFHAHMGWIFRGEAQHHDDATHQRYSPDLMKSPFLRTLDKYYWMTSIVLGIALFAIGGWGMLFWGVFIRTVWGWHATWLVNSATHLWGSRRFETTDDSRNNGWIAAVSWGEGWHNNHHAYPRSAKHGLTWREIDINWYQIKLMEKLGLATEIYALDLNDESKPLRKAA